MACDSSKCAFRFVVFLIGVGILALACYILGTKVIPPIHDYNTEKSDHLESTCTFRYTNITQTKSCSYPIRCPDDDDDDERVRVCRKDHSPVFRYLPPTKL